MPPSPTFQQNLNFQDEVCTLRLLSYVSYTQVPHIGSLPWAPSAGLPLQGI